VQGIGSSKQAGRGLPVQGLGFLIQDQLDWPSQLEELEELGYLCRLDLLNKLFFFTLIWPLHCRTEWDSH
jgi:hypothetical protein